MGHVMAFQMQSSRSKQGVALPPQTSSNRRPHKSLPPSKMDFEAKFFPRIGGFGRYTKRVVVWSWFPNFTVALNFTSSVFLTMVPKTFYCRPDPGLHLVGNLTGISGSVPLDENRNLSRCELLKYLNGSNETSKEWEKVPCTQGWVYATEVGLQSNFVTEVCEEPRSFFQSLVGLAKV